MIKTTSKETKKPSVDIIVRTCQRPRMFSEALESVTTQTCSLDKITIIVVDDSPTAETEQIVTRFSKQLHVKYIKHNKRLGTALALNTGIQEVSGEYLLLLDDDDLLVPETVETFVNFMQANNKLSVSYSDWVEHDINNEARKIVRVNRYREQSGQKACAEFIKSKRPFLCSLAFYRSTALPRHIPKMPLGCDWIIGIHAMMHGNVAGVDQVLRVSRIHTKHVWRNRIINDKNDIAGQILLDALIETAQIDSYMQDLIRFRFLNSKLINKELTKKKTREDVRGYIKALMCLIKTHRDWDSLVSSYLNICKRALPINTAYYAQQLKRRLKIVFSKTEEKNA